MNEPVSIASALAMHKSGRLAEAEAAYRALLDQAPDKAPIWHLLGVARLQQGAVDEAITCLRSALEAGRKVVSLYSDLGSALRTARRWEEACEIYEAAVALDPSVPAVQLGLAAARHGAGRLLPAIRAVQEGVRLDPANLQARFNLATLQADAGDYPAAVAGFRALRGQRPNDARVLAGLAGALLGSGDLREAEAAFRRSLEIAPDDADRLVGLGRLLLADDRPAEAEPLLQQAVRQAPANASARYNYGVARLANGTMEPEFLQQWFAAPGPVPQIVRTAVIDHLAADPLCGSFEEETRTDAGSALARLGATPMLADLLRRTLIDDLRLEAVLTRARRACWDQRAVLPAIPEFLCALGWQCFLNEYVYVESPAEAAALEDLGAEIVDSLRASASADPSALALFACYRPLHTLWFDAALMNFAISGAPPCLQDLIRQQVAEPRDERLIAASLPRLTRIEDDISQAVRAQYEDNPYPRWQAISSLEAAPMEQVLIRLFPRLGERDIRFPPRPRILVAGCGTGHHSVATAQRFAGARVTGVDLSLASLAYATRKTHEAGLANLEYRQADILELGNIEARFDLIESAGVLHHMADPMAGWRVLRGLLEPGGFMKIGLYSELGRASIVAARKLIADAGLYSDTAGIRAGREIVAALPEDHPARQVVDRPDFYSTSTCRDMIFHVQEHRLTVPDLGRMIGELGLEFLGFELSSRALARAYRSAWPDDPDMTNLANWDAFEHAHPGTFAGMYLFWVRDPG